MQLKTANPTTPARAFIGFGVSQSSAACSPEYNTTAVAVQKFQRNFRISELHALTVLRLAGLGPREARS